jgi:O-antigen ligase
MILVICVHLFVLIALLWVTSRRGVEGALPLAACFLILFPVEAQLPIFGIFDLTVQRLVTLVLLAALVLSKKTSESSRIVPLKAGIIFVGLWWTIATANSIDIMPSVKSLLSLLLDYMTMYVIVAKCITSEKTIEKILGGVADGLIVSSLIGVFEAFKSWSVISLFPTVAFRFGQSGTLNLDDARGLRIQSTFDHPILFGTALALGIPAVLHLLTTAQSRGRRLWLWFGLILMLFCIFKTSSRGPWIALLGSLILCFFFGQGRMRRYVGTLAVIAILAMVIRPGVWETIENDYLGTVDDHSSQGQSYIYRYELYNLVMQKVSESPGRLLWGYGPQSFPNLHLAGYVDGRGTRFLSCDSSFAALLAETGYVGLVSMTLLLFYPVLFAFRTYRRLEGPSQQLCLVLFLSLMTFLFQMTNVGILGWGQQSILLWIIMALIMVHPSLYTSEADLSIRAGSASVWNDTCSKEWADEALVSSTTN